MLACWIFRSESVSSFTKHSSQPLRAVQVRFDRERLSAHNVSLLQVYQALAGLNWRLPAGSFASADSETRVEVGSFFRSSQEVANAVVGIYGGRPVYLRDIATVIDGPDEAADYVWMMAGAAGEEKHLPAGLDVPAGVRRGSRR